MQPFCGCDERHGAQAQVLRRLRGHPRRHAGQVARHSEEAGREEGRIVTGHICWQQLFTSAGNSWSQPVKQCQGSRWHNVITGAPGECILSRVFPLLI